MYLPAGCSGLPVRARAESCAADQAAPTSVGCRGAGEPQGPERPASSLREACGIGEASGMTEARWVWGRWRRAVVGALVVAVATLAAPPVGVPNVSTLVVDTFERGELKGWIEWQYNGRTIYRVVSEGQNKFVMAHSRASASAL